MNNQLLDFFNLHNGEENKEKVLENVLSAISFRGSNLWILACAIIIASIGLNVNSTAVIIGAMLISPLMGPILGAGFALGTYDFQLLKKSMKNLAIATIVSLSVSAIYFFLSPFKDVQSELLARTAPNIYDVLIAFFGGLVGVIAITRVEKGNPIPGVAIATALMPPLCTAGYGIATFNFSFFAGAFYLYTINCFFICIATFFVVKYLKYPATNFVNKKYAKQIRISITTLIFIMIIPSFYLAYRLYNEKKFTKTVEQFINTEFANKGYVVLFQKINYNSNPKKIELALLNESFDENQIREFEQRLKSNGVENTELVFRQNDDKLKAEILSEINKQETAISEKDVLINNLRTELAKYKVEDQSIRREIKILFPSIQDMSVGKLERNMKNDSVIFRTYMIYNSTDEIDEQRLRNWLTERLKSDSIMILREEN